VVDVNEKNMTLLDTVENANPRNDPNVGSLGSWGSANKNTIATRHYIARSVVTLKFMNILNPVGCSVSRFDNLET